VLPALMGGAMIGLASAALLLLNGRVAGITGIFAGLLEPGRGDKIWRALFVAGIVGGAASVALLRPQTFQFELVRSPALLLGRGCWLVSAPGWPTAAPADTACAA